LRKNFLFSQNLCFLVKVTALKEWRKHCWIKLFKRSVNGKILSNKGWVLRLDLNWIIYFRPKWKYKRKTTFKKVDLAANLGIGYKLENGLNFGARYNFGLSNINNLDNSSKYRNQVFLCWLFLFLKPNNSIKILQTEL
jgi:hypothetical protein